LGQSNINDLLYPSCTEAILPLTCTCCEANHKPVPIFKFRPSYFGRFSLMWCTAGMPATSSTRPSASFSLCGACGKRDCCAFYDSSLRYSLVCTKSCTEHTFCSLTAQEKAAGGETDVVASVTRVVSPALLLSNSRGSRAALFAPVSRNHAL